MREKKIFLVFWMLSLVVFGSVISVYGAEKEAGSYVYDMAELLNPEEEEQFESVIENSRSKLKFDIVVMTIEDAEGKSSQSYADDAYDAGGFGIGRDKDGILFLIDMDNRELTLSTSGRAVRIFTDDRIETILDDVYKGAQEGDFASSVEVFLEDVQYYGEEGIPSGQYNYDTETGRISVHKSIRWYEALLAVAVSAFVAGTACLTVKRQYAMETDPRQLKSLNMAYRADCGFVFDDQNDRLVNKFVTSTVIPRNTGSTGGPSSGGRPSSRRSSTHRSSSGRSHGGGSRRF